MIKYELLIKKIQAWSENSCCSYFSQSELALIIETLEKMQMLEMVFKVKRL